jgi:hypothetical protein
MRVVSNPFRERRRQVRGRPSEYGIEAETSAPSLIFAASLFLLGLYLMARSVA